MRFNNEIAFIKNFPVVFIYMYFRKLHKKQCNLYKKRALKQNIILRVT